MRRLIGLLALGLFGCPDWDDVRLRRCEALRQYSGYCEGTDAGVPDAGVADAGFIIGPDGGAIFLPFDALVPSRTLQTDDNLHAVRSPVSLSEMSSKVLVVESRQPGFSLWREGNTGALGSSSHQWCSTAANAGSLRLGYVELPSGGSPNLSVDDLSGSQTVNDNAAVSWCSPAMAQQRQGDGGIAFLLASSENSPIELQRCTPPQACPPSFTSTVNGRVDEAAIDGQQAAWFSLAAGTSVGLMKVLPDSTVVTQLPFTNPATSPVQVSAAQTSVHAAWLEGQTLWLGAAANSMWAHESSWQFPAPVQLIDLVQSANTTAVLLAFGGRTLVLLHRDDSGGDAFFVLAPTFRFKPTIAHLKTALRIAGQCLQLDGGPGGDGGAGCAEPWNNPVLEFTRQPDGGTW